MGNSVSRVLPCFTSPQTSDEKHQPELIFSGPLDETLGHSFCYIRSVIPGTSSRFSPSQSDRFSPSQSDRFEDDPSKTTFKSISGASVSANSSNPKTILAENQASHYYSVNGFESTSSFSALPLQPVPRGAPQQHPQEVRFMSGPLERGFMSGPIERGYLSGPLDNADGLHFSAPLGGFYLKKKKKGFSRKAFFRSFSEKQRPWVVPVLNFVGLGSQPYRDNKKWYGGKDSVPPDICDSYLGFRSGVENSDNLQWAHGKAGEDRVHVVVSEELGWLFVGIYDGFNGPEAPEFLMSNLYNAVFNEFEGLLWDVKEDTSTIEGQRENAAVEDVEVEKSLRVTDQDRSMVDLNKSMDADSMNDDKQQSITGREEAEVAECRKNLTVPPTSGSVKRVTFQPEQPKVKRGKPLRELLAEEDDDELDLSGSGCFTFSVDNEFFGRRMTVNAASRARMHAEAVGVGEVEIRGGNGEAGHNYASNTSKISYPDLPQRKVRSVLLSKMKHGFSKHKESRGKFFPWQYDLDKEKLEVENKVEERLKQKFRKRKVDLVDHALVLRALAQALEDTEAAYLEMTDKFLDQNPELALMGSCLLVVLMKDEDVYVMNLGDSRAIVAQYQPEAINSCGVPDARENDRSELEGIVEESSEVCEHAQQVEVEARSQTMKLTALQLSTDHSTSIEEEVLRIKAEHPDDSQCIINDRVKGRLKVTRAFGAGFLKHPKLNNALLEMFRNEYIGTTPYLSCSPSLCHHELGPNDQFLVLSSDGLYQYLSNQEVVSYVESFMEKFPEGDPAQYLIEELLFRAAKKAGLDFHELLDIPQGDRRKYHDDVTVMVISLEGRIWKSSGKYL